MSADSIYAVAEDKMEKSLEALQNNLSKIRTGRAVPGLLDHVHVDYYGSSVPIGQVANVTVIDARTLGVSPWEKKMVTVIDRAIRESDLGLNPSTMGELIRVPLPSLSEERRRELTKVARNEGEHTKVAVRNVRRDAIEHLKRMLKDKEISEDDERRWQDDVQKLTDRFVSEVDKVLALKEQEILTV